jgi:UDP-N-acetyl-D-mannosaminuronic acid dehydrogenase
VHREGGERQKITPKNWATCDCSIRENTMEISDKSTLREISTRASVPAMQPPTDGSETWVGMVGLGYVGLPVAALLAASGLRVVGLDRDAARIARIQAGECPIEGREPELPELLADVVQKKALRATTDPAALAACDVILVAVETPVDETNVPRYVALQGAVETVGKHMKTGALVVIESTIAPGTMRRLVIPTLERVSGKKFNEDFFVGHCPERVMPGRLLRNLREMSRVCGGSTPEAASRMVALYSRFVGGEIDVASCEEAELTKTGENAFRDVSIAFANELAQICERVGADFLKVRALINKSPGRNVLLAGGGVGGHCIPKDPWLLAYGAPDLDPLLLRASRARNEGMPIHVADLVAAVLSDGKKSISGARIAVLGMSYLEDSDDMRHTPSEALVAELEARGATVVPHDPYVHRFAGDLGTAVAGVDCIVLMVAHTEYKNLDWKQLGSLVAHRAVVDARFVVDGAQMAENNFSFRGVGRPRGH